MTCRTRGNSGRFSIGDDEVFHEESELMVQERDAEVPDERKVRRGFFNRLLSSGSRNGNPATSKKRLSWEKSSIGLEPLHAGSETDAEEEELPPLDTSSFDWTPSYWLGCSYRYNYRGKDLHITIRQTGCKPKVMAASGFKKLTMQIVLDDKWSKSVLLMESRQDNRFRSTCFTFRKVPRESINQISLRLKVIAHFGAFRSYTQCKWLIPLEYCYYKEQTEYKRCLF